MATIIFDLDGTLVDTAPDLTAALNAVLGREGLPTVPDDEARPMIGRGVYTMLERALARAGAVDVEIGRLYQDFLTRYGEHLADRSRPYPGVVSALDSLVAAGCTLAVCTNKFEGHAVRLLTDLGLADRFAAICGQDTFPVKKPDPGALTGTLRRACGTPGRAVMVGDSETDIAAAKAVPMPVVAVDFGYTDVPVRELEPDRIISCYRDLPAAVAALLCGRAGGNRPDGPGAT